jgi:hypothetical protein
VSSEKHHWLRDIQGFWAPLSVFSLGIALAFNVGYFHAPTGADPFTVNVEDLAKSFLYVIVLLSLLQALVFLVDDLTVAKTRIHVVSLIVAAAIGILLPPVVGIHSSISEGKGVEFYYNTWSLAVRFLAGLLLVLIYRTGVTRIDGLPLLQTLVFSSIALVMAFSFGAMMFYQDLMRRWPVNIHWAPDAIEQVELVGTRSQFIMLFSSNDCSFSLVQKEDVRELEYKKRDVRPETDCIRIPEILAGDGLLTDSGIGTTER